MAKKKLADQTTEELKAQEKKLKVILLVLLAFILAFGGTMVYLMSKDEIGSNMLMTTVVPMIFIVLSFIVSTKRNLISNELRNRDHKQT
ncbi:undecaprenyl pyrophosphate phosphatase UppP [Saonia flava]|uniref:Undecaprenyl pyrophosphate phosphatase UppP n=1 Tax=Saonia flava TaxID=523696 RepID=A0A846QYM2_9FLAO|nr:hypothetical protein [Saonia flava]NJB71742.1 undecaprenyl pyrophosphate phosphatase UppP [Saonia flava]